MIYGMTHFDYADHRHRCPTHGTWPCSARICPAYGVRDYGETEQLCPACMDALYPPPILTRCCQQPLSLEFRLRRDLMNAFQTLMDLCAEHASYDEYEDEVIIARDEVLEAIRKAID